MGKRGALITLVVLVAVVAFAFVGHGLLADRIDAPATAAETSSADESAPETEQGKALLANYDARVYTDLGEALLLSDIADGRPLVINFWATWCPYCVQEMPDFQQIVDEYGDRVNFAFVDVADGRRERVEDAQAWLADQGFSNLPVYYDTDLAASTSFGAYALPTTVVVAADGEILSATAGAIDPILMRATLEGLV